MPAKTDKQVIKELKKRIKELQEEVESEITIRKEAYKIISRIRNIVGDEEHGIDYF